MANAVWLGIRDGLLIVLVMIAIIIGAVVALPDKTRVCVYDLNAQGQKVAERCWTEWGDR